VVSLEKHLVKLEILNPKLILKNQTKTALVLVQVILIHLILSTKNKHTNPETHILTNITQFSCREFSGIYHLKKFIFRIVMN
jgi:hypothetical protein